MFRFTSVCNILHFLDSMSLDLDSRRKNGAIMKQGFMSTGVVNICSLVKVNSDNFIDTCKRYNVPISMYRIDIKSGFKHVFSIALVIKGFLWYLVILYRMYEVISYLLQFLSLIKIIIIIIIMSFY